MADFPVSNVGPLTESDEAGSGIRHGLSHLALQRNIRQIPKGTEGMEIGKDQM